VSRLTGDWKTGRIIRVNLTVNKVNKDYAEQRNVEMTPTFILFDTTGREVRRWTSTVPEIGELP
jgi:thioredoxin-related protein